MNRITTLSAVLVLAGCAASTSTGVDRADAASTSMGEFRDHVRGGQAQLELVMAALNRLSGVEGDLKPAYHQFVAEVDRTEAYSVKLKADGDAMRAKGREFFRTWEDELDQIKNEEMRVKSRARAGERIKEYAVIEEAVEVAREKWSALSAALQDVKQYLANDLTSKGIASLAGTITKANLDSDDLKKALLRVSSSMDHVQADFAAQAKQ